MPTLPHRLDTRLFALLSVVLLTSFVTLAPLASSAQDQPAAKAAETKKAADPKKAETPNPVFVPPTDDPKLPRVLLIGDSISIGYTLAVREELKGVANVHRIPENGGPTSNGLAKIDKWLGDSKWDVIHFNWGLHDLKLMGDKHQIEVDEYKSNLRKLITRMKATNAKLIWCTTTPVPEKLPATGVQRRQADGPLYNKAAAEVVAEFGLQVDDLYTYALERLDKIQIPQNVHFTPEGSKVLAKQVAASIREALKK